MKYQWINVNDELPSRNTSSVLICSDTLMPTEAAYYRGKFCVENWTYEGITHWMPMISRPEEYL